MDESDEVHIATLFHRLLTAHSLLSPTAKEEVLLNKLRGLVTNIKWSPEDVADLFDALLKRFESTNDRSQLLKWMIDMLHCIEINYITSSWTSQTGKTLIQLARDQTVTEDQLQTCLADETEKKLKEILEEIRQERLNQVDEKLLKDVEDIVSSVHENIALQNDGSQHSGLKETLQRLCLAVEVTAKFKPRLTQMVSWCFMALSKTGWLIQVGTGEGKSCIVAMFAAFRAIRGEKVDIMSSSSVLAERDLNKWREFYKVLGISVACNTNKMDNQLKDCYECQVVYGTAEQFAGDWLKHRFRRMGIFGQRKFQCAIVDEVDLLMLDKGHHVVYLSDDMTALQHLNPLLAFIWATANQYSKIGAGKTVGRKYPFHQVVLNKLKDIDEFIILQIAEDTGLLARGSVKEIRRNPSLFHEKAASATVNQLAEFFNTVEGRFPSCQFAVHCRKNGAMEELNERPQRENGERVALLVTNGGFCQYMYSDKNSLLKAAEEEIKRALHFTPCEVSHANSSCYVPGFFSELVESKLKVWIKNAFLAQSMTKDDEYIMERHGIVPVDYSCTGVVENYMKWTDGLQQFLEMKHESKLSNMTAITNYMSNVGVLQKYGDQIYGMSGTLGQQAETEMLQKIYEGIKTCQIPSFKRRKLFEVEGLVVDDEEEWIEKVCDVVMAQINSTSYRGRRAVLVICETINRANVLHDNLGDKVPNKQLYVNNNMDNRAIFSKNLDAGEVIIATNLAGRGTDLQVSDSVKTAGGLFVLQTFLPKNARVEAQAFGRTARQGSPGSAQLIVCSSHLSEPLQLLVFMRKLGTLLESITDITSPYQDLFLMRLRSYQMNNRNEGSMSSHLLHSLTENPRSEINIAKKVRDDSVARRLASYLDCDIPNMKKKEALFSQYLDVLDDVYRGSNNEPAAADLSALNEFWGMWLLTKFNEEDSVAELKSRLHGDLNKARRKLRKRESPSSNLHHYTAFGNDLRVKGNLAESIDMYTKAIQEDPCWAAVAYYNRAFASLTQQNRDQDLYCLDRALEDLQNACKSVELYCQQLLVTHGYATQQTNCSVSMTRFDKHITARYRVLLFFKENINEAIKKVDRARDIGGNVKVAKGLVNFLSPLETFNPLAMLLLEPVTVINSREPLRAHQLVSHPSFDIFNELRCLESLGLTQVYTLDTLFSLGGFFSKIGRTVRRAFN